MNGDLCLRTLSSLACCRLSPAVNGHHQKRQQSALPARLIYVALAPGDRLQRLSTHEAPRKEPKSERSNQSLSRKRPCSNTKRPGPKRGYQQLPDVQSSSLQSSVNKPKGDDQPQRQPTAKSNRHALRTPKLQPCASSKVLSESPQSGCSPPCVASLYQSRSPFSKTQ
jgi:hypothetical protein